MGYALPTPNRPGGYVAIDGDGHLRVDGVIVRTETAAAMASILLDEGELAYETDTGRVKAGDGLTLGGVPLTEWASSSTMIVRATGSAVQNGSALLAAYAQAKTMTPNGEALAADNRATVLVGPGVYDLGTGTLTMDAPFVDLVGCGRDVTRIVSARTVVNLTANDVLIQDVTLHCTDTLYYSQAIGGGDLLAGNTLIRLRLRLDDASASFTITPYGTYSGLYVDVMAEGPAGQPVPLFYGHISGTAIHCVGGDMSFASIGGTVRHCIGGMNAFATLNATARAYYCIGGSGSFADKQAGAKALFCVAGDAAYTGND
jgi:hypothetical protein